MEEDKEIIEEVKIILALAKIEAYYRSKKVPMYL